MYASDLTHKKRSQAVYRNLQLQKEWFASGKTIRILGQKGGNDYSYMIDLEKGCNQDICWKFKIPIEITYKNGPIDFDLSNINSIDLTAISENGYALYNSTNTLEINGLDDGDVPISTDGRPFYFFGVECGITEKIWWNSNNVLFFGSGSQGNSGQSNNVSPTPSIFTDGQGKGFISNSSPCILLGNYDRRLRSFYTSNYNDESNKFSITRIIVTFNNYLEDDVTLDNTGSTTRFLEGPQVTPQGQFSIRLIRELTGDNRQWVEVTVIKSPLTAGYSSDPTISYPSGVFQALDVNDNPIPSDYNSDPQDRRGNLIDINKISPYDISDGTRLLNVCGTQFSKESPQAGTSFIFQSDALGKGWIFANNAYLHV